MTHFVYFAYGSNLLAARLRARCPSAVFLGRASAVDHTTAFDVRSRDGSTKLGLRRRSGRVAHGALWRIDEADREGLAAAEGVNYVETDGFAVIDGEGGEIRAVTWLPKRPPEPGLPFDWYRDLALAGARECGLPAETIDGFAAADVAVDPMSDRPGRREALAALATPFRR
ncbi:MAG: gamma-glutamylcyclotransferase [Hyphomicrobiales bacterium]|nr:gamma-glutamylcyclotransferase [Hyphomicrobiales bacterium]